MRHVPYLLIFPTCQKVVDMQSLDVKINMTAVRLEGHYTRIPGQKSQIRCRILKRLSNDDTCVKPEGTKLWKYRSTQSFLTKCGLDYIADVDFGNKT